jgi:hypothetical protein
MTKPLVLLTALLSVLVANAAEVDQSNTLVDFINDEGQGSGQIFTAGKSGFLVGLRLCMRSHNYPRDFRITLNTTSNGAPTTNTVTHIDVDGSLVSTGPEQWYTFMLTNPCVQHKGDKLCFVYYSLPPSDPVGWNDLAFDTTQSYTGGFQFVLYGNGSWTEPSPRRDYSFETLILPAPALQEASVSSDACLLSTDTSDTSLVYTLKYSTNLVSGLWFNYSNQTGTGSGLNWLFTPTTNDSIYFMINTEQR